MAAPPSQRARHRFRFAAALAPLHPCWLLWLAAGCHMVGYDVDPLTTADAGEPIATADAELARSDAEPAPEASLPSDDVEEPAPDAAAPSSPSSPDAAETVRPDMPVAVRPSARDAGAQPAMPLDEGEPRGDACRGPGPCDLNCERSSSQACTARCIDAPVCALTCEGPNAASGPGAGQGPETCQLGCDRVNTCTPACEPGSRCAVRCRDTNECFVGCEGGSACEVACEASTCAVNCAPGAACLLRCAPGTACGFWECRMGERVCANGVRACGTRCPEER
jgi:hypothetical protein